MRWSRKSAASLALAVGLDVFLGAEALRAEPGDELSIHVLTFGPGDHPFFKFGHNAILIHQPQDAGAVFNFGTFAFDTPGLIRKFLRGRLHYWLSIGR
jgi:hypothetical protein